MGTNFQRRTSADSDINLAANQVGTCPAVNPAAPTGGVGSGARQSNQTPNLTIKNYLQRVRGHTCGGSVTLRHRNKKEEVQMNKSYEKRKVLRVDGVGYVTSLCKTAIYDKGNKNSRFFDPSFPARFKIGARSVGWDASEIDAWVQAKKEARIN